MIFWMWLWCSGSLVTSTASGRSRARMANAPSRSPALRASTAVNASPRPGAASRSCSRITPLETLSGFHSSATRAADGMISLMSCSRFGAEVRRKDGVAGDVAARMREALHQAGPHRIADRDHDDRDRRGGGLGGAARRRAIGHDHIDRQSAPVRPPPPRAGRVAVGGAIFKRDGLSLDIAGLAQRLAERFPDRRRRR